MAGAYTHISIVRLLSVASSLESISGLHPSIIQHILDYPQFVELGSVAPDYPLLHLISSSSKAWSDRMHFEKTADPICAGLRRIKNMPENKRPPLIAWLLGYLSHYTVDLVIHPVIETKVGIYEKAARAHRRLEMLHDAFVFSLLECRPIEAAELIESGIKLCTTQAGTLDIDLRTFWSDILSDVYPEAFRDSPPQINTWHSYYTGLVDDFAEEQGKLPAYSAWLLKQFGLVYPRLDEVKDEHLKELPTPEGEMDYRFILKRSIDQTAKNWAIFSQALVGDSSHLLNEIGDWNMGTGKINKTSFAYWRSET